MSRYSSSVSKGVPILDRIFVVLVLDGLFVVLILDGVLVLALISDNSLLVESSSSLDSFFCFVSVTTDTIFSSCLGEFSVSDIGGNEACFVELLHTGGRFFVVTLVGLGRSLTGKDKYTRESVCSCCIYFFALLLQRFLESESFFGELSLPFSFFLPPGINHLGVIYYRFSLFSDGGYLLLMMA